MNSKKVLLSFFVSTAILTCPQEGFSKPKPLGNLDDTPLGTYRKAYTFPLVDTSEPRHIPAPPVKDQAPLGTCAIFTATGLYETIHLGARMSEAEFAVYAETQIDDCREGINLGNTLRLAREYGFIPEAHGPHYQMEYVPYVARINQITYGAPGWEQKLREQGKVKICRPHFDKQTAYNTNLSSMGSPLRLSGNAGETPYKLSKLRPIYHVSQDALSTAHKGRYTPPQQGSIGRAGAPDLDQVRRALAQGNPIAVAAEVYDNCWKPKRKNEFVIKYPEDDDQKQDLHAFMLTGYDGDYFRIRNSWGSGWADQGYAWMPSEYLRQFAHEIVAVEKVSATPRSRFPG